MHSHDGSRYAKSLVCLWSVATAPAVFLWNLYHTAVWRLLWRAQNRDFPEAFFSGLSPGFFPRYCTGFGIIAWSRAKCEIPCPVSREQWEIPYPVSRSPVKKAKSRFSTNKSRDNVEIPQSVNRRTRKFDFCRARPPARRDRLMRYTREYQITGSITSDHEYFFFFSFLFSKPFIPNPGANPPRRPVQRREIPNEPFCFVFTKTNVQSRGAGPRTKYR